MRSISLVVLCLLLHVAPAVAQTVYSNGPTNGNIYAWTVNFGFIVSDTFTLNAQLGETEVTGAGFSMWLFPGDTLESAELSFTSNENGGTSFFDATVNFQQSACSSNQFGFSVCNETTTFSPVFMFNGTYWLNLQNARVSTGDPVYWDQNFGGPGSHAWPQSLASENSVGTIPSESFTIYGQQGIDPGRTTTSVPEPSSLMLFGSGILGLSGWVRRKLF